MSMAHSLHTLLLVGAKFNSVREKESQVQVFKLIEAATGAANVFKRAYRRGRERSSKNTKAAQQKTE